LKVRPLSGVQAEAARISVMSCPSRTIRVALVGYGLAGAVFHAPLIAAVDGLELSAIVTRDPERRTRARRDFPHADLLESADEIWARPAAFELVVVAAPNRVHVPLARAAIDAGLGVVVDKPLAASAPEARELVDAARARDVLLTVFQNRRWDGDFLTASRLIAEQTLGRIFRFESRFERWRPERSSGWRELAAPEEAGGLLYDLGSHLVDQALVLFGPARQVYAELDVRRPGAEVDDDAFVAVTHDSGVRSHLWMSVVAAQFAPRLRLLGDRAAYVKYGMDVQEESLHHGLRPGDPGWGEEPEERWGLLGVGETAERLRTEPGAYQRFYEVVAATIRGEAPPPVDPEDAVSALDVLDAARTSAREGKVVRI
jgi:predicted dehydrogenase